MQEMSQEFLLSCDGRIPRSPFNITFLYGFIALIIAYGVDYLLVGGPAYVSGFVQLVIIWPSIALMIKRLHDINRSGWWMLAGMGLPSLAIIICVVILMVLGGKTPDLDQQVVNMIAVLTVVVIAYLCMFIFLVFLSCKKGTTGSNRFGADPLQNLSSENIPVSKGVEQ